MVRECRMGIFALGLAALVAAVALVSAPRAKAALYISHHHDIALAGLDGEGLIPTFMRFDLSEDQLETPTAVHNGYLYWVDEVQGLIGRVKVDGSDMQPGFVSVPPGSQDLAPISVTVSDAGIFWGTLGRFSKQSGPIGRADLNGANVDPDFINTSPTHSIGGPIANDSHIYWTGGRNFGSPTGTIGRANVDGSGVNPELIVFPDADNSAQPGAISLSSSHIYWSRAVGSPNGIGRARLDGTEVEPLLFETSENSDIHGTAVAGGYLYWSFSGEDGVGRANLNTGAVDQGFLSLSFSPSEIEADELVAGDDCEKAKKKLAKAKKKLKKAKDQNKGVKTAKKKVKKAKQAVQEACA